MDERADQRISSKIVYSLIITKIKPTSAYEATRIYYITDVLSLLEVSAIYCGHPQGCVFRRICYKGHQKPIYKYEILSFKCKGSKVC
jgi:hypothetical protein